MFILVLKRFNLLKTYVQIVVMFRCKCEGKVTDLYSYVKILSMTNLINSIFALGFAVWTGFGVPV